MVEAIEKRTTMCLGTDWKQVNAAYDEEREALELATKQNLFMAAGIVGFKYKSEIILDFPEAYKILGLTAPEV